MTRKRLYFDIETSPCIGYFWRPSYKANIPYRNIIQESAIICICYKWEGRDKVHALTWDRGDDKAMLEKFVKIAEKADEIVGHNGDRFDMKWVRARCIKHQIPMLPKYITVDTLKGARGQFLFNSNRLDYIAKFLDVGGKIETGGFDLWVDVMNGKRKALRQMVEYCKNDVVILEKVYDRMKNYLPHKSRPVGDDPSHACPECGNPNPALNKSYRTPAGTIRRQMRCICGKNFTISNKMFMVLLDWRRKH